MANVFAQKYGYNTIPTKVKEKSHADTLKDFMAERTRNFEARNAAYKASKGMSEQIVSGLFTGTNIGPTKTSTPATTEKSASPLTPISILFKGVDLGVKRAQLLASPEFKGMTDKTKRMQIIEKQPGIAELIPQGLRQIPGYSKVAEAGAALLKPTKAEERLGIFGKTVPTLAKLISLGTVDIEHPVQSVGKISEAA